MYILLKNIYNLFYFFYFEFLKERLNNSTQETEEEVIFISEINLMVTKL